MTGTTVFPGLPSADLRWADRLSSLTPVEQGESGLYYKREDAFAPLGYGGINGAKLRQLIHLVQGESGARGIITAASVRSPQISMAALVGRHYGLPVTVVLGATRPSTARRHENVGIALRAGARFVYTPVGFNPALQRACDLEALKPPYRDWFRLHYGITTRPGATVGEVQAFHRVGARQAANIPPHVRTLVVPAGSCNSVTSLLYGIALHGPASLSRVVMVGIGPNRLHWLSARLLQIEQATGRDVRRLFTWRAHHGPEVVPYSGPVLLEHYDLHGTGWVRYDQRMPWRQDGISFHPTYEGKVMRWLSEERPHWWRPSDGSTLFWIIGSEPTEKAMEAYL